MRRGFGKTHLTSSQILETELPPSPFHNTSLPQYVRARGNICPFTYLQLRGTFRALIGDENNLNNVERGKGLERLPVGSTEGDGQLRISTN